MGASNVNAEMPFIFTAGMDMSQPHMRKLIRRHVMLGKNRGKTRNVKSAKTGNPHDAERSSEDQEESLGLVIKMRYSVIPKKVGSELSFTQFASPVEPHLMQDVMKFSFIAKKVMFPLESCIDFHKKNKVDLIWFELLTYDAVYMHAVVFSSQAYFSIATGQKDSTAARRSIEHHSKTLRLLRERLATQDEKAQVADPTIFVVLCLTLHAHFIDDHESAKHHMEGLRKIVEIRGGLNAFGHNPKLAIDLMRCDLGIALHYGIAPMFSNDAFLEYLVPSNFPLSLADKSELSEYELTELNIDSDLVQVWIVLKRFCLAINSAAEHSHQLPKETLLNAIASVMYPLLRMNSFDPTSINEAIRLGLLAFSSHIFLHWQQVNLPHTYFPQVYRSCLLNINLQDRLMSQLLLWLLIIGDISLFNPVDETWLIPWVRTNIDLSGAHDWSELRSQLKAFPWIGILHDKPGKAIFDSAISSRKNVAIDQ